MAALDDLVRLFRVSLMGTLLAMSAMFLYRSSSFSRLVFLIGGGFGYFFPVFLSPTHKNCVRFLGA
jgi:hypothetical protein